MWFKWLLMALYALGIVSTISQIDKPRPKTSRADAILSLVFNGALIYGVLHFFK